MSKELAAVLQHQIAAALRAGDLAAADQALERLEAADPLAASTRGLRLEWLLKAGRLDDAAALAGQLAALFPASPRIRLLAGQVALARRDHAVAGEHLRESDKLAPSPFTRRLLGQALTNLGQLDEAEALLIEAVRTWPRARKDLAWLYERRGEIARAVAELELYRRAAPEDDGVEKTLLRLRARLVAPEALIDEVDALLELGEDVAPQLVPEYVGRLLERGLGERARAFVAERRAGFDASTLLKTAWVAYQHQAHDVAYELFVAVLGANAGNPKFLTSLVAAARRAGRLADLAVAFEAHAPQHPSLYGRAAKIRRELGGGGGK